MKPRRDLTLILSFIIAVGPVSVDMYLPAFGQIAREFRDQSAPQRSLAWHSAGFAAGQITFGPVSDWKGRRPALMVGLALYIVASLGCALSAGPASFCAQSRPRYWVGWRTAPASRWLCSCCCSH